MTQQAILPPFDAEAAADWMFASSDLMGGRVSVHVRPMAPASRAAAARASRQVLARIGAWATQLTRFDASSELSRLNAEVADRVEIGPTLTAVLDWGRGAEAMSDGVVDIGLLDARLLAESGVACSSRPSSQASRSWSLLRHRRGSTVERPAELRFDLDGIAKGWLADRALDLLPGLSAVVDADGDIAVRVICGEVCDIGVADPFHPGSVLTTVRLTTDNAPVARYGIATSGTSVHRWSGPSGNRHHLIDPRTGLSARTDLVQATVIARTARAAEAFAKTAVIVGSEGAATCLDRQDVLGQILVTESGDVLVTPATLEFMT